MKEIVKPEQFYTVEEYLAFERENESKHEYISGLIVAMAGASRAHNLITGNVARRLGNQLEGKPCETYSNDMRVRTTPTEYTYPDVVVVCGEPEFEDDEFDTLLNPTVIVEVLSKSTARRDRVAKLADYRGLSSLKEYILISQDKMHIEHYVRRPDNEWSLTDMNQPEGKVTITSINCEFRVSDVYDRVKFPPPRQLRKVSSDVSEEM
ncbi:MAG: Uma2 family endonuclease [Acidobacteriota bacterium]|nr:Uma2 family endonuclease [Acidobacteriota bacterium]